MWHNDYVDMFQMGNMRNELKNAKIIQTHIHWDTYIHTHTHVQSSEDEVKYVT